MCLFDCVRACVCVRQLHIEIDTKTVFNLKDLTHKKFIYFQWANETRDRLLICMHNMCVKFENWP